MNEITYDYFYGSESEQFSYYRIPRLLITGAQFRKLSTDAKLLYGLLLDRMGLSARNGWYDDAGKVFIYYTVSEIEHDLNCGHDKAIKLLAELDNSKGIGLIERVKQGQGKPTRIYVKRFTTTAIPPQEEPSAPPSPKGSQSRIQDFDFPEVQTSDFPMSGGRKIRSVDVGKTDPNYNNIIYPDKSYLYSSIYPSESPQADRIDRRECRAEVKESIEYDQLRTIYRFDELEEIVDLMTDVLCSTRVTMRIGGEALPIETVKDRFWRLDQSHIEYVLDRMKETTTKIRNIRSYLLTALYNAPTTINHHFQAEVQHDLYGKTK